MNNVINLEAYREMKDQENVCDCGYCNTLEGQANELMYQTYLEDGHSEEEALEAVFEQYNKEAVDDIEEDEDENELPQWAIDEADEAFWADVL